MKKSIQVKNKKEMDALWKSLQKPLNKVLREYSGLELNLLEDIFKTAVRLAEEKPGTLNLKIATTAFKELRYAFKIFNKTKDRKKVTIFGSARLQRGTACYEMTKKFAKLATKNDFMVITGGGPGIMAAGNEGSGRYGFGLNIRLPFEQSANPFIDEKDHLMTFKYFFTRKLFLVKEASAFAFFPGGFGTLDEVFEVLTLLQTGKNSLFPVVLLEPKGYGFWEKIDKTITDVLEKKGLISKGDRSFYKLFNDPQKALRYIQDFYANFITMRFFEDTLVIWMQKPLPTKVFNHIQKKYSSITVNKQIQQTVNAELPCLEFKFRGLNYAALRQLVDEINKPFIKSSY